MGSFGSLLNRSLGDTSSVCKDRSGAAELSDGLSWSGVIRGLGSFDNLSVCNGGILSFALAALGATYCCSQQTSPWRRRTPQLSVLQSAITLETLLSC